MHRAEPLDLAATVVPRAAARAATAPAPDRTAELARSLAECDPMRMSFDVAVRRFVRVERRDGRDLDAILATLAAVLRRDVEPRLAPERRAALQHAVAWFAVSEYHRAD